MGENLDLVDATAAFIVADRQDTVKLPVGGSLVILGLTVGNYLYNQH